MSDELTTINFDGVQFTVRDGTFDGEMAREIFEDRYYTCDGWGIPAGGTVLDIGGNIGAFAAYAALKGAGEVHTFEPMPDTFALLVQNTARFPRIKAHQEAISVKSGPVRMSGFFAMSDGVINTGLPAISDDPGGVEVQAVSIHDVLASRDFWDVVKIDIEGYEFRLLEDLTDAEFEKIGMFTMEFHHPVEADTEARGRGLEALLKSKGYATDFNWAWGCQGRLRARR